MRRRWLLTAWNFSSWSMVCTWQRTYLHFMARQGGGEVQTSEKYPARCKSNDIRENQYKHDHWGYETDVCTHLWSSSNSLGVRSPFDAFATLECPMYRWGPMRFLSRFHRFSTDRSYVPCMSCLHLMPFFVSTRRQSACCCLVQAFYATCVVASWAIILVRYWPNDSLVFRFSNNSWLAVICS